MQVMFRALVLILVMTFAAGTAADAVRAADMAVEMAPSADGAMPGCDGCGEGDGPAGKLACAPACMAPAVAILGSDETVVSTRPGQSVPMAARASTGRPAVVDPYPPRSNVLI